ncbi:MAG: hypothetical protein ACXVEF_01035 [Polyangiales bacterium]
MTLLALEQYADIAAELDAGAPRDETLAAMNITLATYLEAQQHWLSRIAAEAHRGRSKTFDLYNARFLEKRREVRARLQASDRAAERARRASAIGLDQVVYSTRPSMPSQAPTEVEAPLRHGLGVAGDGPRLTLSQYASLCAELAVQPDQDAAIRARYGFDTANLERERAGWEARFASTPTLFAEYLAYFRHYRDWLLGAQAKAK